MGYTAIFGGTFNPPHIGHYEMLECLNRHSEVDKIWVMPTKIPPHKVCDFLADDNTRKEMCKILSGEFDKAETNFEEFEREGKSYTYDTITLFKQKYPNESFAFVCGGDMLTTFDKWYKYEELMKMLPFFVFRRSDIEDGLFDSKVAEFRKMGMLINVIDKKITAVSSTEIRNDFEKSKALIPQKIYDYINKRGIYSAGL